MPVTKAAMRAAMRPFSRWTAFERGSLNGDSGTLRSSLTVPSSRRTGTNHSMRGVPSTTAIGSKRCGSAYHSPSMLRLEGRTVWNTPFRVSITTGAVRKFSSNSMCPSLRRATTVSSAGTPGRKTP